MHSLPDRHSIRLSGYDYSQDGSYFITIISQNRVNRFGKIVHAEMILNDAGRMVESEWTQLSERFPYIKLDHFQMMPNHFHGIITMKTCPSCRRYAPKITNNKENNSTCGHRKTVVEIIGRFKSITTNRYANGVRMGLVPPFNKRLWQLRFWDRIIRNDKEYHAISNYIVNNPRLWTDDTLRRPI